MPDDVRQTKQHVQQSDDSCTSVNRPSNICYGKFIVFFFVVGGPSGCFCHTTRGEVLIHASHLRYCVYYNLLRNNNVHKALVTLL